MTTTLATSPMRSVEGFSRLTDAEQIQVLEGYAKLEPRQKKFFHEYLVDLNATQAAIRAKYSKRTANRTGPALLSKLGYLIFPILKAQQQALAVKGGVTREQWLEEIRKLAFFDPRKFFDNHGNPIEVCALDDESAPAIAGFEFTEEYLTAKSPGSVEKPAEHIATGYTKKFKLTDKLKALELYGKATGFFPQDSLPKDPLDDAAIELILAIKDKIVSHRQQLTHRKGRAREARV